MIHLGETLVAVNHTGICWSYNICKYYPKFSLARISFTIDSKEVKILNKTGAEIVKSVYLNVFNSSILLISIEVSGSGGVIGQMKCR